MSDLRYPIGKFSMPQSVSCDERDAHLFDLEQHPSELRAAVAGLSDAQLDTPYRPDGWTVRQVVHHLPDSHMNSYIRFKLAMTEDSPTIRPYEEDRWAELAEARSGPIALSLNLLETLHARWLVFLRSLNEREFQRTFVHPQFGPFRLEQALALYAWHGKHHVAHITALLSRQGW
jgi:uncharacterized damage-inducible protein DinB